MKRPPGPQRIKLYGIHIVLGKEQTRLSVMKSADPFIEMYEAALPNRVAVLLRVSRFRRKTGPGLPPMAVKLQIEAFAAAGGFHELADTHPSAQPLKSTVANIEATFF